LEIVVSEILDDVKNPVLIVPSFTLFPFSDDFAKTIPTKQKE
jgi:hypothetical protein